MAIINQSSLVNSDLIMIPSYNVYLVIQSRINIFKKNKAVDKNQLGMTFFNIARQVLGFQVR